MGKAIRRCPFPAVHRMKVFNGASMSADNISRRDFVVDLSKIAVAASVLPSVAPMIVPRHVLGRGYRATSDTLNVAIVGAGGMGMSNWTEILKAGEKVVAICDVDFPYVE